MTGWILLQVFDKDMDKDAIVLLAARASRLENQDAIDTAIINMLADPKEVEYDDFFFLLPFFLFAKSNKIHIKRTLLPVGTCKHHGSAFFAIQSRG